MDSSDTLAVVAIIISVIAFFASMFQVFQTLLATAEGYRRCVYSVIGPWYGFTHRVMRWSELRFETTFKVPRIRLGATLGSHGYKIQSGHVPLDGRPNEFVPSQTLVSENIHWVCWVRFLEEINELETQISAFYPALKDLWIKGPTTVLEEKAPTQTGAFLTDQKITAVQIPQLSLRRRQRLAKLFALGQHSPGAKSETATSSNHEGSLPSDSRRGSEMEKGKYAANDAESDEITIPTFSLLQQSWDFVPDDVLKPLAVIGLSDLVILTIQLGMRWQDFRPFESAIRAEGNQLVLTSEHLRTLGCVVNLRRSAAMKARYRHSIAMIPKDAANAMAFGVLPAYPGMGFEDPTTPNFREGWLNIGTVDDVCRLMSKWDPSGATSSIMRKIGGGNYLWGFLDVVPLVAPFLRSWGSKLVRLPSPLDSPVGTLQSRTVRKLFPIEVRGLVLGIRKLENDRKRTARLEYLLEKYWNDKPKSDEELRWDQKWYAPDHGALSKNEADAAFLDEVQTVWSMTQAYFCGEASPLTKIGTGRGPFTKSDYAILVKVHVRWAIIADQTAQADIESNKAGRHPYNRAVQAECFPFRERNAVALYSFFKDGARQLKQMFTEACLMGYGGGGYYNPPSPGQREHVTGVQTGAGHSPDSIFDWADFAEAWVILMLRAFCWYHCHHMVEGTRVPSEYWDSQMPIYMG